MGNTSVTTFEFRTENAERNLDKLIGKTEKFDSITSNLGKNISLGGNVPKLSQEVDLLSKQLKRLDNLGNSLNPLQKSAISLKGEITSLRSQIQNLNNSASASKSNNSIFNKYEVEAEKMNKQLTLAELKLKQLDGIRGKTSISNSSSGFGNTLKSLGAEAIGDYATGFGVPAQFTTMIQGQVNALSTATLVSATAIGALAVAGVAIVKYSESVRNEAEKRLKVEENIAVAMNKQVFKGQEIINNLKEQRELASRERNFSSFLESNGIDELKKNRDLLQKIVEVNPTGANVNEFSSRILAIDAKVNSISKEQTASQDKAFSSRLERFVKNQDDEVKRREQAQAKFIQSVELGKKKVDELGKTYNDVFDGISNRLNSDNSFVKFFSNSDKSLKALRENTKGLDSDLQNMALNLEKRTNQASLFSLRLDTNLTAFSLRDDAERFRNPINKELDTKRNQEMFDSVVNRNINGANSTGQIYNKTFGSNLALKAGGADKLTDAQKRQIYQIALLQNTTSGLNQDSLISSFARENLGNSNQDLSVSDRLEKQFSIVRNLGASSDAEKSLANRKIIELTSGLNPNELTISQREQSALAREREAERLQRSENEAQKIREKDLEIQVKIEAHLRKLSEVAEKQGLKGIENLIRIVDETDGKIRVGKTPTQSDVAKRMNQ